MPATVSGWDAPVVRPETGSKGRVHRRFLSLRILKANFRPSEDTAMSVSLPAPVVKRSSPSIQRSVDGTTFTFQRFLTPCDSPSKIKPFAEGIQRKLANLTPASLSCDCTAESICDCNGGPPFNGTVQKLHPSVPCLPQTDSRLLSGCQATRRGETNCRAKSFSTSRGVPPL